MRLSSRYTITLVLTVIYMAITIWPLAPLALRSKVIAHAVTGECSGDCDICGCSPERRASQTCCCCLKKRKQQQEHDEHTNHIADCCKNKHASKKTIMTCGCPLGNGKTLAFSGTAKLELLPYHHAEDIINPSHESLQFCEFYRRLASRHGEPPDPPPRLSLIS